MNKVLEKIHNGIDRLPVVNKLTTGWRNALLSGLILLGGAGIADKVSDGKVNAFGLAGNETKQGRTTSDAKAIDIAKQQELPPHTAPFSQHLGETMQQSQEEAASATVKDELDATKGAGILPSKEGVQDQNKQDTFRKGSTDYVARAVENTTPGGNLQPGDPTTER